jgi:hypothetical protein
LDSESSNRPPVVSSLVSSGRPVRSALAGGLSAAARAVSERRSLASAPRDLCSRGEAPRPGYRHRSTGRLLRNGPSRVGRSLRRPAREVVPRRAGFFLSGASRALLLGERAPQFHGTPRSIGSTPRTSNIARMLADWVFPLAGATPSLSWQAVSDGVTGRIAGRPAAAGTARGDTQMQRRARAR